MTGNSKHRHNLHVRQGMLLVRYPYTLFWGPWAPHLAVQTTALASTVHDFTLGFYLVGATVHGANLYITIRFLGCMTVVVAEQACVYTHAVPTALKQCSSPHAADIFLSLAKFCKLCMQTSGRSPEVMLLLSLSI